MIKYHQLVLGKEVCSIIPGPVSAEVLVCVAAAKAGAHIAIVPYKILMQMIHHPLTDIGVTRFLTDWQRVSQ